MEGKEVYKHSLEYLDKLNKENATDSITIDYSKLDTESKKLIKDTIQRSINIRKREIYKVIMGSN